jgi:hypothetical protein
MSPVSARQTVSADLSQLKARLRQLYIQWCVSGPTLESSSALAAMAQEETGHTRILSRLAAGATGTARAAELMPAGEISSWPELIGTAGPLEIALAALLGELKSSGDPEFSRHLPKMAAEERHHAQFFTGWFEELGTDYSEAGSVFVKARETSEARIAAWLDDAAPLLSEAGAASASNWTGGAGSPDQAPDAACVHCGSRSSTRVSAFGTSLMTELRKCDACGSDFESVRWKPAAS